MNDKWTENEMVADVGWAQTYSGKALKAWSFALSAFVFFGILFFSDYYSAIVHLFAFCLFLGTAIVFFINERTINKQVQALVVITGFIGSIGLIVYANV